MKKLRLLILAFAAMVAGTQNGVAQDWTGHTPGSLVGAEGEAAEIYLWNVGTNQFLYTGGNWGTQAITYDTGTRMTITRGREGWLSSYWYTLESQFTNEGGSSGYLSLTDGTGNSSVHDSGIWFLDALSSYHEDFRHLYFTAAGEGNRYYVSVEIGNRAPGGIYGGKTVYLVATGINGEVTAETGNVDNNANAQWMLVTLDDIRANFSSETANAAEATPLDATYILYDQHFMRNNTDIGFWHTGDVNITNEQSTALTIEYPDIDFPSYENRMLAPTDAAVPQYYVGNGYGSHDDSDEGFYDNTTDPMQDGESHQKLYGNYWTANIKGEGAIWQKVRTTVNYPGWYIVSCDGLTTKTEGTVELFASTYSDANMENLLDTETSEFVTTTAADGAPETYTAAGRLLYTNKTYQK